MILRLYLTIICLAVSSLVVHSNSHFSAEVSALTSSNFQIISILLDDTIQALRENNTTNAQIRLDLVNQELAQIENHSSIPTVKVLVEESLNALKNNDSQKTAVLLDVVKGQLGTLTNQSSLPYDVTTTNIRTFENVNFGIELDYPDNWDLDEGNSSSGFTSLFITPMAEKTGSGYLPNSHIFIRVSGGWANTDLEYVLSKLTNDSASSFTGFKLLSSSTTETLSGVPAYSFTYNDEEINEDGSTYVATVKEIGTVVNDYLYEIRYSSDTEDFDVYLPTVERIIQSFTINR